MSVRLANVSFRYPAAGRDALRRVSITFRPGEVVVVTGRLGAGCSTLLLTIAGLAPHVTGGARDGEVRTLERDPASKEGRKALAGRVGLLLPTPWTQLSGMAYTVRDEVAFGPANLGWSRERISASIERAADLVGVARLLERDPRTLSGGELQRVMLAGVIAMEPDVYLLDEPTLELDPAGAATAYALLPRLAARATVVLASTDIDRAVEVVDRVVLLEHGALVGDGPPDLVLGTVRALRGGYSTTVAEIAQGAGLEPVYPLTVGQATHRFAT